MNSRVVSHEDARKNIIRDQISRKMRVRDRFKDLRANADELKSDRR